MTIHSKPKPTSNPWMARFLYLPVPGAPSDSPEKAAPESPESTRRPIGAALRGLFGKKAMDRRTREALAVSYENLLAGLTHTLPFGLAHPNWRAVRVATPLLERLADRLRQDPGVRAHGIARAKRLLSERESALYARDDVRLADEARSVLAAL
jgi:hypothetical protein